MTPGDVAVWLGRFAYRDGWRFSVVDDPMETLGGLHLRVECTVTNGYRPEPQMLDIHTYASPNDIADEDAFQRFLLWRLARIETHECREFFTVDGGRPYDPHKVAA